MTIVRTINTTNFSATASGDLTHPNPLPSTVGTFLFKIHQDTSTGRWDFNGAPMIDVTVQYALDGVNFVDIAVEHIFDEEFPAFNSIPQGEYRWAVDIPDVGSTTRKCRIHYQFHKSSRLSGTLEVL